MATEQRTEGCQEFFIGSVDRSSEQELLGCLEGFVIHKRDKCSRRQYPFRLGDADFSSTKPFRRAAESVASGVFRMRQNRVDSRMIPLCPSYVLYILPVELASNGVHRSFFFYEHAVNCANPFDLDCGTRNQNDPVSSDAFAFTLNELHLRLASSRNQHSPQAISGRAALFEAEVGQTPQAS